MRKETWAISVHPLAPGIPIDEWYSLTKEQQDSLTQTYERIERQQNELQKKAEDIEREFKKLPFWRRVPCYLRFHDIDDSMEREHIGKPDTFMRIIFCRRCGAQFYSSPLGLRKMR